jgi:hypothetical protein
MSPKPDSRGVIRLFGVIFWLEVRGADVFSFGINPLQLNVLVQSFINPLQLTVLVQSCINPLQLTVLVQS